MPKCDANLEKHSAAFASEDAHVTCCKNVEATL